MMNADVAALEAEFHRHGRERPGDREDRQMAGAELGRRGRCAGGGSGAGGVTGAYTAAPWRASTSSPPKRPRWVRRHHRLPRRRRKCGSPPTPLLVSRPTTPSRDACEYYTPSSATVIPGTRRPRPAAHLVEYLQSDDNIVHGDAVPDYFGKAPKARADGMLTWRAKFAEGRALAPDLARTGSAARRTPIAWVRPDHASTTSSAAGAGSRGS